MYIFAYLSYEPDEEQGLNPGSDHEEGGGEDLHRTIFERLCDCGEEEFAIRGKLPEVIVVVVFGFQSNEFQVSLERSLQEHERKRYLSGSISSRGLLVQTSLTILRSVIWRYLVPTCCRVADSILAAALLLLNRVAGDAA